MKRLCAELEEVESRRFELERMMKDYVLLKTEQLPALKDENAALRYELELLRNQTIEVLCV